PGKRADSLEDAVGSALAEVRDRIAWHDVEELGRKWPFAHVTERLALERAHVVHVHALLLRLERDRRAVERGLVDQLHQTAQRARLDAEHVPDPGTGRVGIDQALLVRQRTTCALE